VREAVFLGLLCELSVLCVRQTSRFCKWLIKIIPQLESFGVVEFLAKLKIEIANSAHRDKDFIWAFEAVRAKFTDPQKKHLPKWGVFRYNIIYMFKYLN